MNSDIDVMYLIFVFFFPHESIGPLLSAHLRLREAGLLCRFYILDKIVVVVVVVKKM